MKRTSLLFIVCGLASAIQAASPAPAKPAAAKADQAKSPPGQDPGFAFLHLERLLRGSAQIKAAEAKLEEDKNAAEKEYERRIADYRKLEADLAPLHERVLGMNDNDPARAAAVRERDERAAALRKQEGEINGYRQAQTAEMQGKAAAIRDPFIADLRAAAARLGSSINLLFDVAGNTLSSVPFVVRYPSGGDITTRLAGGLEGKDSGGANSARGVKVGLVDMNKVFTDLRRTKEAEAKIQAAISAARANYEKHTNAVKEESAKLEKLTGAEREKQAAALRKAQGELNDFQNAKSRELQDEMMKVRQPILFEMVSTLAKLDPNKAGLIFDSTGLSVAGAPFLVWSKGIPDFSTEFAAILNGESKAAARINGVASTGLRFGLIDVERAYRALPDGQKAETEIQEEAQRASVEMVNADAETQMQKQQQLASSSQTKRRAVLEKITTTLNEIGTAGSFNAVFDSSGHTLAFVPAVIATNGIPDLTDEVVAKAGGAH